MRERRRALFQFVLGFAVTVGCLVVARVAFAQVGVEGIEEAVTDAVDSGKKIAKILVGLVGSVILVAGLLTAAHKLNTGQPQGFWQVGGVLGGAALVAVAIKLLA
jgi:hypothetical protein